MRVRVTRSGGVTGVILDGELDTATLAAAERTDVERILARLEGADSGKPPQAADRFQYDVTIATEDDTRRLTLNESDVPAELGELLTTIAQRRPPSVDRSTEGPE